MTPRVALLAPLVLLTLLAPPVEAAEPPPAAWNQGDLQHILPGASHERFLIKLSFHSPLDRPPVLDVSGHRVAGTATDSRGRFWQFDVPGLAPATTYDLRLLATGGRPLTDAWPLRTFPAPEAVPERPLRVLAFTCPGGFDAPALGGKTFWLDMAVRRRLLARGLAERPDVVLSTGDQIYWDHATFKAAAAATFAEAHARFGLLDPRQPMRGSPNEDVIIRVGEYQIASLYGVRLRSLPVFFMTDDHDLFENDEGSEQRMTLPPERWQIEAERAVQRLFYPEFLPDPGRPDWLEGASAPDRPARVSEAFGTLRYGRWLEALLYDTKRFATVKGIHAGMVPVAVEEWLVRRTRAEETTHLLHVPSTSFAWSAGKLGDWYPDALGPDGLLEVGWTKSWWPWGWWLQHQRLLAALTGQQGRAAVALTGDIHAHGVGVVRKSGRLTLDANPLHVVIPGALGTGDRNFPSFTRGSGGVPSALLVVDEVLKPVEANGFTVLDVSAQRLVFRLFHWRPPTPAEEIDGLQPFLTHEVAARRR